ncbi:LamG domain-containing protein [Nannocystis radixulma]|uniref:LamG domain-containing protein n=1 Tax=Nannocystis radixulma TaxID=2995305 RepID=A0ABT5B0X3_9BACT|nr:LamG domain-containing protein [Nannocystis radixulma]MDC0667745.1 LamG domain-containing protein [Nannocystis radixulma]
MTMNYLRTQPLLCLLVASTVVGCTPTNPSTTETDSDTDTDTDTSTTTGEPPDPTTSTTVPMTTTEPTGTDTTDGTATTETSETTETTAPPVNTPPTAPVVAIEPAMPTRVNDLTCVVATESEDAEGDSITYAFAWTRDGEDAGVASETVTADQLEIGQVWECSATPNDGTDDGPAGTASATVLPVCAGVDFDGNDDYIAAAYISAPTAWTIEAWVNPGDQSGQRAIVSQADTSDQYKNFELGIKNSKPYVFAGNGADWGEAAWPNAISSGEWHHIAGIYDGTDVYIAVDGVVGAKVTSAFVETDFPLHIGTRLSDGFFFDGKVFEVRVSSTARYTEDFDPAIGWIPDTDTLALWRLDEGEGAVAADSSDSVNEGTINGEAAWVLECPGT